MSAHQLLRAFIHGETGQHHQAMERKGLEMNTDSAVKQEDTTDGRENPVRTPISRPGIERDVVSCVNEIAFGIAVKMSCYDSKSKKLH